MSVNRREFLLSSAASSLLLGGCELRRVRPETWPEIRDKNDPLNFQLVRPSDNFSADLEVFGFDIKTRRSGTRLIPIENEARLLVFKLPPQHFPETTISRSELNRLVKPGASTVSNPNRLKELLGGIALVTSKRSQIVFSVPDTEAALPLRGRAMPLDLDHLLAWENFHYEPEADVLDPYANDIPPAVDKAARRYFLGLETWKGEKRNQVSAIDLPAGFYLQPESNDTFFWKTPKPAPEGTGPRKTWSAFATTTSSVRSELINLDLIDIWGVKGGTLPETGSDKRTYKYFNVEKSFSHYGPYPNSDNVGKSEKSARTFNDTAIDFYNRMRLAVTVSPRFDYREKLAEHPEKDHFFKYSDHTDASTPPVVYDFKACYSPDHQVRASVYGVSADGGWIEFDNKWSARPGCDVNGASYTVNRGRDVKSRVSGFGHLFCLGLECELVWETSREYLRDEDEHLVSPPAKEFYIRRVNGDFIPIRNQESCFRSIRLVTPRTPPLDVEHLTARHARRKLDRLDAFVPIVDGEPFQFAIEGIRHDGTTKMFNMPLMFITNRQTTNSNNEYGRFPERSGPGTSIPENSLQWPDPRSDSSLGDLYYVYAKRTDGVGGSITNLIKLIDNIWERLDFRFVDLGGSSLPLAPPTADGDTTAEVKWVEFVRGARPAALTQDEIEAGKEIVDYVMSSRIRTARIALPSIRQYAGDSTEFLVTYRDMRVFKNELGNPIVFSSLDPEETQLQADFDQGLLSARAEGNSSGAYLCVLPVSGASHLDVRNTFYHGLRPTAERVSWFEGMKNLVEFGRAKTSEGLGGLMSPDSPLAIITTDYGPVGDNNQNISDYRRATGMGPLAVPAVAKTTVPFSKPRSIKLANAPRAAGIINLGVGSLFGDDAEILPGIKITQVIDFILSSGDTESLVSALGEDPSLIDNSKASGNGMQWKTEITGLDWILNILGSAPGQIPLPDLIDVLLAKPVLEGEGEPITFGVVSRLDWRTSDFKSFGGDIFKFLPENPSSSGRDGKAVFSVSASATLNLIEPKPEISASSDLTDFGVVFLDALKVNFNYVKFSVALSGEKNFTPSIADVRFSGSLAFIDGLRNLLKQLEDQFGLRIDITPQRVSVSQVIAFPPGKGAVIYLGPATISNLNFNWGVVIPIIGRDKMRVTTGLASREAPMTISVGIYGGRCYAIFEADTTGPRLIEVSADYGGVFEAEWGGLAKGSVSLTAGFAFILEGTGNSQNVELVAYSQFSGNLSVISLISVNSHIYIALGYKSGGEGEVIYGIAKASVAFRIFVKKFRVEWESYHEERNGQPAPDKLAVASSGVIDGSDDQVKAVMNSPLNSRAVPEQTKSEDYFYPFGDTGSHRQWSEFFDAFKT